MKPRHSLVMFGHVLLAFHINSCVGAPPIYTSTRGENLETPRSRTIAAQTDVRARFIKGEIFADIYPRRGEGYLDMAIRISHKPKQWQQLKTWNKDRRFPQIGTPIRVPFAYLNAKLRNQVIRELFKNDKFTPRGWEHKVTYRGETMWFIADTFTGDGSNYPALLRANDMKKGQALSLGSVILIPSGLLSEEFSSSMVSHTDLTFEKGANGKLYAIYELKPGEALYSSVVVRFTGRVEARDVNEMAAKIMRENGITDPRKIPAGKRIRIPFDDLSDDIFTGGAPDRIVKVSRNKRGSRLHIILDPGHGGSDPGAIRHGVTEDELAYDVMLRVKKILERSGATVYPTVSDPHSNGEPIDGGRLSNGKNEQLNTTPPYTIHDARVSVNLRVFLVNAIYQKLRRQGIADEQIFFISIHVDHLHPSMSGAMVYYPSADERNSQFAVNGSVYQRYVESRATRISFSRSHIRRAESFSYDFSRQLIASLQRKGVPVHKERPIRPYVYRKNQRWAPAIVRYSLIPTSVLLEVSNMANSHDFSRITDHRFRQRVAEAIAAAILT